MVSVCASAPNLCFRGMCVDSPSPFLCECQPGWTSDLTIFWMNDCSMPDYWMDVLGGVTLGGSLAVFVYGLLLLREPRKGAVRKVLERVVAMQLFGAAAAVTVLVEQRVGPTFLLFMALSTSLMTWSGAIFIREFLRVATKSLQVTIPQQKLLTLLLRTFPLLGGGPFFLGAFGGYATQGDPAAYNLVICIMLFISPILQIVSAPILVISTTNLINLVKTVKSSRPKAASSGAVQKQEELMAQLVKFRNMNVSSMCSYMLTTPTLAVVYLCLGSLPYSWVITFILATLNIQVGVSFFVFMHRRKPSTSSKSGGAAGENGTKSGTGPATVLASSSVRPGSVPPKSPRAAGSTTAPSQLSMSELAVGEGPKEDPGLPFSAL